MAGVQQSQAGTFKPQASPDLIALSKKDPKKAAVILQTYARTAPTGDTIEEQDENLRLYIEICCGVRFPRRTVTRGEGVSTQLKWICDNFYERIDDSIAMGARASGKTLGLAVLSLLNCVHKPNCETVAAGAQLTQPKRCMKYVRQFLQRSVEDCGLDRGKLREQEDLWLFGSPRNGPVVAELLKDQVTFTNGSSFYAVASTLSGVSGPHPQKAIADELEHWSRPEFEQFTGMATQGNTPWKRQQISCSTRQRTSSLMSEMVSRAEELGIALYWWSILDVLEPCGQRFGGCLCHPEDAGRFNPENCILWEDCQGACVYADGSRPWEEIINIKRRVTKDTWETQYLCRRPSSAGLVYSNFNSEYHVTEDAEFHPDWPVLIAADPAMQVPYGVVLAHRTPQGFDIFDVMYETGRTTEDIKKYLVTGDWPSQAGTSSDLREANVARRRQYIQVAATEGVTYVTNVDIATIDTRANQELVAWVNCQILDGRDWVDWGLDPVLLRGEAGDVKFHLPSFPMRACKNHQIRDHVMLVRGLFEEKPYGPAIRVHPRCVDLISELTSGYRFRTTQAGELTDVPGDDHNHLCDALGYLAYATYGTAATARIT